MYALANSMKKGDLHDCQINKRSEMSKARGKLLCRTQSPPPWLSQTISYYRVSRLRYAHPLRITALNIILHSSSLIVSGNSRVLLLLATGDLCRKTWMNNVFVEPNHMANNTGTFLQNADLFRPLTGPQSCSAPPVLRMHRKWRTKVADWFCFLFWERICMTARCFL